MTDTEEASVAAAAIDLAARPASMTKPDARRLTAQIKRQLGDVQDRSERLAEMVRRAHRENAWAALGYASWDQWLKAEFPDLTRGQKYRLVAWGEVVGELEAAAGAPVEVSGRAAAKAKRAGPSRVAERVREQLAGKPDPTDEDRAAALASALADPIEATATKVEPSAPAEPAAVEVAEPEANESARARDPEPVAQPEPAVVAAPAPAPAAPLTAGALLVALVGIDVADATDVELADLDRLSAWTGLARAAVRRRGSATTPPSRPATPAPAKPAAARQRVETKAADCAHPVGQRIQGTCMACGTKVGK